VRDDNPGANWAKENERKCKEMKAKVLSFVFISFSGTGLFNRLQPIQIKKRLSFLRPRDSRDRLRKLATRRHSPRTARKRDCDPTIPNDYHKFPLIARF
jgi:hypothetical protein